VLNQPSKVLADGCFDPLHVGHLAYLQAAAKLGRLYVQIAPDSAIRAKGRESFQTQMERRRTVQELECVLFAVTHSSLEAAIRFLRPDVLAKGRDWLGKLPGEVVAACREVGTVIVYTDTQERTSTERLKLDPKFYRPGRIVAGRRHNSCGLEHCMSDHSNDRL
jgi:D-glycero-beta-D-manno-heptose 1-phosphate adenylyltransferase